MRALGRTGFRCAQAALALTLAIAGCSHEVLWTGEPRPDLIAPAEPIPMTVAVELRSFETSGRGVDGRALTTRFAERLRDAALFQAVMFPVPPGERPLWEIALLVKDARHEPNGNFWKGALVAAVLPLAPLVHMEEEYTLEVEALLTRRAEVVRSYSARGAVRERYQYYSDERERRLAALETVLDGVHRHLLAQIAADARQIAALDRARSGS
jgi:hypothetical protein